MNVTKRIINAVAVSLLLVSLVSNFSGCSKDFSPISPIIEENDAKLNNSYGFKVLQVNNQIKSLAKEFVSEKWISPWGGAIEVGDLLHGQSSITFLPGSVDRLVKVRFWWESTGFLTGGSELTPHGLTFDPKVLLKLSYKDADLTGVDENNLKIYYFNEATGIWEPQFTIVNQQEKLVITWLEHFSRYAIGGE